MGQSKRMINAVVLMMLIISGISNVYADVTLDHALIAARIAPVGKVVVSISPAPNATAAPAPTPAVPVAVTTAKPGPVNPADKAKEVVETKCAVCHSVGLAGSPKFGDEAAWKPRIAKGNEVLFTHVKQGFNAMPPKGTCMECTDDELKAAIQFMISQAQPKKK